MALYRKYRPASFAEVVGQQQVTRPLSVALDSGRINHAYLFSGPRGCGKTSSARILARSLNCVQGPTSSPCGECNSCISLAPGGPGNLDVTELDAASHNGVDDMRELRDKAHYAPADSRYRVFIIDEAHMISPQGFNAMLKIVEEPPEHLIFIFATTEPEKVIGTIRSRTHHYPFRLLTPGDMRGLLQRTAESEGVQVEDSVYPLVIEAGGGSPRDSLSILDQLVAGSGEGGVSYEDSLGLLGVTDLRLIDAAIDALAAQDGAGLFRVVDEVIEAGHEPRRFVTDLLSRLRDLMILQSVPSAIDDGLVTAPTNRAQILQDEAAKFSGPQLAHLATQVNERIADMRGATAPRLLLEILCAHLLLPSTASPQPGGGVVPANPAANTPAAQASASASANQQVPVASHDGRSGRERARDAVRQASAKRTEQKTAEEATAPQQETRQQTPEPQLPEPAVTEQTPQAAPQPASDPVPQQPVAAQSPGDTQPAAPSVEPQQEVPQPDAHSSPSDQVEPQQTHADTAQPAVPEQSADQLQRQPQTPQQEESREPARAFEAPPHQQQSAPQQPAAEPAAAPADAFEQIRTNWAKLRGEVGKRNKVAEIMLTEARVLGIREETLVLGHNTGALAERLNEQSKNDVIVAVLQDELGLTLKVNCVVGTNPESVGFPPPGGPQPTWNPTAQTPQGATTQGQSQSGSNSRESGDSGEEPAQPAPTAEPQNAPPRQPATRQTPAQDQPPSAETGGWGTPAPLGGPSPQSQQAPPETPPVTAPPAQNQPAERKPRRWEQAVERGNAKMQQRAQRPEFSDGIPLPPEPDAGSDPYDYPADEGIPNRQQQTQHSPAGQPGRPAPGAVRDSTAPESFQRPPHPRQPGAGADTAESDRNAEEEEMLAASLEPGQLDRRDANAIAMELLANELGAKPL